MSTCRDFSCVVGRRCLLWQTPSFNNTREDLHMDITRMSIPKSDWLYSLHPKWRSSIQSAKTRPGTDCGSDHELIAKFRLKLKKVGKTTRPFRYDLNQIPYNYTVDETNRFKELDLIDRVPEELWMEIPDIVLEAGIKTIPKKKKCKKANGCLRTNSWGKKRHERQRRKGKI